MKYETVADIIAERDALKARLDEQDMQLKSYSVLRRAVNESTNECGPDCNDHAHADGCPALSPSSWLEDQQREIERLRGYLSETHIALANAECREGVAKARLAEAERLLGETRRVLIGATQTLIDNGWLMDGLGQWTQAADSAPLDMVPAPDRSRVLCVADSAGEVQK